jgi:hypothetical protein
MAACITLHDYLAYLGLDAGTGYTQWIVSIALEAFRNEIELFQQSAHALWTVHCFIQFISMPGRGYRPTRDRLQRLVPAKGT